MLAVSNNISGELYFIYGLILLVILLIITIIIIDRIDNKKERKRRSLSDTLNMKPITEDMLIDTKYKDEEVKEEISTSKKKSKNEKNTIPEIKIESKIETEEEIYEEPDLEKTQAQIRVEEITKALEDAKIDEKIEKDKYEAFEEEQEKNAIISYEELINSYDKLYEESEKTQYLDDDTIPINIKELYELTEKEEPAKEAVEVELEEEILDDEDTKSTFKSSPFVSPVYGIQNSNTKSSRHEIDKELDDGNKFLENLKELRSNLE